MKVTAVDTIQVAAFHNLVWVEIHTDEGLVGLGETFRNPHASDRRPTSTRPARPICWARTPCRSSVTPMR
jgi:L-alanine-DL-glutamate epimerase-like enolase superfamily enzyme